MGYDISDMVQGYLGEDDTDDVYYHCTRGIARALAREKVLHEGLGIDYEVEEPFIEEYEKKIKAFVSALRTEIYRG